MRLLLASLAYFGIVFAAGFVFGPMRVLWLEPWFGPGIATAIEAPFLLAAMAWAALRLPARFAIDSTGYRFIMGLLAVSMVILADITVGRWLGHMPLSEQAATLVKPAGAIYLALLIVFTVMPWALGGVRRVHAA